jgi:hypothetical protein
LAECHHEARNTRAKLKDATTEAINYGTSYEIEVVTARVHERFPELFETPTLEQEREDILEKELKSRENRRSAQRYFKKLGRERRGRVKPNSIKKSFLMALDVPGEDGI